MKAHPGSVPQLELQIAVNKGLPSEYCLSLDVCRPSLAMYVLLLFSIVSIALLLVTMY